MCVLYRYVPILKAGQAELSAIAVTSSRALSAMRPVFEIINFPPSMLNREQIYDPDVPPPAIEKHIVKQLTWIANAMHRQGLVFIDLHQLSRDILWRYPLLTRRVFINLYLNGIQAIPVVHADTPAVVLAEFKEIHAIIDCGFMIRLNRLDMSRVAEIRTWLNCPAEKIDILLDYGSILDDNMDALVASAAGFINTCLPNVFNWRSLTMAAGAFPLSLRKYLPAWSAGLARLDSRFWFRLIQCGLKRAPWFADYGILHPDSPALRRKNSSTEVLSYTTSDQWRLLWSDQNDRSDLRNCCKILCNSAQYDGLDFSYADRQILLFASDKLATLDAADRKIIGFNRHFEKVCSMLPNLVFPGMQ